MQLSVANQADGHEVDFEDSPVRIEIYTRRGNRRDP